MKILQINTFSTGGAAKACLRLNESLVKAGIESGVLVLYNEDHDPDVINYLDDRPFGQRIRESIISRFHGFKSSKSNSKLSYPFTPYDITSHPSYLSADVIHLHWIAKFLDYRQFFRRNGKPVIWTLHDLNPIRGLIHYDLNLEDLDEPQIREENKFRSFKSKLLKNSPSIVPIAISRWMKNEIDHSKIFSTKANYLPNGLDLEVFKPGLSTAARSKLGLPQDKVLLLFVSNQIHDRRKGFNLLKTNLDLLSQQNVAFLTLGEGAVSTANTFNLGFLNDEEKLVMAYQAADILLIPSLEDNLPNTLLESLACGVPAVGFDVGGIPDLIKDGETGFKVAKGDMRDFLAKVNSLTENPKKRKEMGENGRKRIEQEHNILELSQRLVEIYSNLIRRDQVTT